MTWPTTRYPTSQEIYDRLVELQARPTSTPLCTVTDLVAASQGGKCNFMRLGKAPSGQSTVVVVFTGGVHAREWAPPVSLVNLLQALLDASVGATGITCGGFSLTPAEVADIIAKVDLYVAPMINPDGYDFSRKTDKTTPLADRDKRGWRKNRRPVTLAKKPIGCSTASGTGVDINRNFDVLWDFTTCYVGAGANVDTSKCPDSIVFAGDSAFSEIESKNVRTLLGNNPAFYVDVHMWGPTILHSWGIETNTSVSTPTPVPTCSTSPQRDGTLKSTDKNYTGYAEPINATDLTNITTAATKMHDASKAATTTEYKIQPGALLYPTSGAADDYAFFRSLGGKGSPTYAFTIECGKTFLPLWSELPDIQNEVQAALLALLKHAASTVPTATTGGSGSTSGATGSGSGSSSSSSSSDCFIATAVYGGAANPNVQFLRDVRDRELPPNVRRVVVGVYNRVGPPLARFVKPRPRLRDAVRRLVIEPVVAVARILVGASR